MNKKRLLLLVIPLGVAIPFLFGGTRGRGGPIRASNHASMEKVLGFHLLAPTHLPRGLKPGENGIRRGAVRVLCDYTNDVDTLIVAQEHRNPERDAYNHGVFDGPPIDVNGHSGTFTRGSLGERRLAFYTPEVTVILSSATLSDNELLAIGRSMR